MGNGHSYSYAEVNFPKSQEKDTLPRIITESHESVYCLDVQTKKDAECQTRQNSKFVRMARTFCTHI